MAKNERRKQDRQQVNIRVDGEFLRNIGQLRLALSNQSAGMEMITTTDIIRRAVQYMVERESEKSLRR